MSRPCASAPLHAPLKGRATAAFARRSGVLRAVLAFLLLFAGPAGLAAPCATSSARCPGGECGGPACSGCAGAEEGAGVPVDDASASVPPSAGCSCGQLPAERPPDAAVLTERVASSQASGNAFAAWLAAGPTARFALEPATGSGSPPGPREPLYLRHCVLRN